MSRILLSQPTTFYVATNGSDTTGDGTQANPWATPQGAHERLKYGFDLGGRQVTVMIAQGVYNGSNNLYGNPVGQTGYIRFEGAGTSEVTTKIKGTTDYCFGIASGCHIQLVNMWLEGSDLNDTVSIGNGSALDLNGGMVFGNNVSPWNDITVNGYLSVTGAYTIYKSPVVVPGTWGSGSNSIQLSSLTGVKRFMGVSGFNIPVGAYVSSISGNTINLEYVKGTYVHQTTGNGVDSPLTFSHGGQCHLCAGNMGRVYYNTNNDPAFAMTINVAGYPLYSAGFVYASGLSYINKSQINFSGAANCSPFDISENSVLYSGGRPRNCYPGVVQNADGSYGHISSGAVYS